MKKLYRCKLIVMVMGENEDEAEGVALYGLTWVERGELEIFEALSIPDDWKDARPFGSDTDETCGEIIKRQRQEA